MTTKNKNSASLRLCVSLFLALASSFIVQADDDQPPLELKILQDKYQDELQRVTAPVTDKYIKALQALKIKYTKVGNLDMALKVVEKIKASQDILLASILVNERIWAWAENKKNVPIEQIKPRLTFYPDGRIFEKKGNYTHWGRWEIKNSELKVYNLSYKWDGRNWITSYKGKPMEIKMLPH